MTDQGFFNNSSYSFLNNKSVQNDADNIEHEASDEGATSLKEDAVNKTVEDLFNRIDPTASKEDNTVDSKIEKIVKLLENRFKIRKQPHSLNRLKKVLEEDKFKEYYDDYLFDEVVKCLESKFRTFEREKKNTGRIRSRKRKR
jgi:hypothetical protein